MTSAPSINVGIGFATGRKNFQKVLRSYIYNWQESGLVDNPNVHLHLFIAYDLSYNNTHKSDYCVRPDLAASIDRFFLVGRDESRAELASLAEAGQISAADAGWLFKKGYAAQRNAVLFSALKQRMDYLIFLDDDEYPVAVTNNHNHTLWSGQHALATHLEYLPQSDLTHGYHCGYVSPIPYIEYNQTLTEGDFQLFIEAISNDILRWDTVRKIMNNGGITYADTEVLVSRKTYEVPEVDGAKFISGANLGINLRQPDQIYPFFNPPGARGEDAF